MNKNTVDAIYHACRCAFICGQERVPWHMTLHAIREGLDMEDCKTYNLKEHDYQRYSQLRELVQQLKLSLSESTEQPSPTFIISASDNGG